jgi:ABC-2 type transport system ATP-binding protein
MLQAVRLTKRYNGLAAVREVSLTIPGGCVTGYLGPNGSGKSTTVKMLAGLLPPSSGDILFEGVPMEHRWLEYKARLGYVPEEPLLYPYLTAPEYLRLVGRLRGMAEAKLAERIDSLLCLLALQPHRHLPIASFSKGMRQKVLIIAALLHDPDVLIFGEPLSGLDVTAMLVFRHLLTALAEAGKAILYSSHVLEVVERICSRVIILDRGRIVADDEVSALRAMMQLPSLEHVFTQLVSQEDAASVAHEIIEVIRA